MHRSYCCKLIELLVCACVHERQGPTDRRNDAAKFSWSIGRPWPNKTKWPIMWLDLIGCAGIVLAHTTHVVMLMIFHRCSFI
uniref:Uncharacterized protein n=1 Tax=Setaria italica TaxID=4555 RepID=K3ZFP8_SETIT